MDSEIVVTMNDCDDLSGNSHGRRSRSFKNGFDQVMALMTRLNRLSDLRIFLTVDRVTVGGMKLKRTPLVPKSNKWTCPKLNLH
ncbi:hypothetical protein N7457_001621 [Penicillium paradoxum]|uniref:uncharacterized protein n=1 Tax=Penicillium paradoxum TaxID=176176 RepID=UPI002547967D|nr:uncharacterized protein N7457_001621 [Penicillium paradoxum]KAJ5795022.1 hypothetical protein N7457_001621 [Penicillium paradoxum]